MHRHFARFRGPVGVSLLVATGIVGTALASPTPAGAVDTQPTVGVQITSASNPTAVVRINAGGSSYRDSWGQSWSADQDFVGGTPYASIRTVLQTPEQTLYQTSRYGMAEYNIPVPSVGTYTLRIHTSEPSFTAPGLRIFSVAAEGRPVLTNFDIWANTNEYRPVIIETPVTVIDGVLNLSFTATADHASVNGIEVLSAVTPTPTPRPTPTPTPARAVSIGEPFVVGGMQVTIRSAKYACTNLDSGPLTGELCPANAAPTDTPLTIELAPVTKGTPGLADLKYWLEDSSGSRIDIALDMADSKSGTRLDTFLLSSRSTDLRLLSANGEEVSLSQILVGL